MMGGENEEAKLEEREVMEVFAFEVNKAEDETFDFVLDQDWALSAH